MQILETDILEKIRKKRKDEIHTSYLKIIRLHVRLVKNKPR